MLYPAIMDLENAHDDGYFAVRARFVCIMLYLVKLKVS